MKHIPALIIILLFASAGMNSTVADDKLTPPQIIQQPQNDFEHFFNFRLEYFKPATEPLIVEKFGVC